MTYYICTVITIVCLMGNPNHSPPRRSTKASVHYTEEETTHKLRKQWLKVELLLFALLMILISFLVYFVFA